MAVPDTPKTNMLDQDTNAFPKMLCSPPPTETGATSTKNDEKYLVDKATNTVDSVTLEEKKDKPNEATDNVKPDLSKVSRSRKLTLLGLFTFGAFLDSFNNSALFPAIPVIANELGFDPSETVWIISGYPLTFAAFLLMSGRISDVYTPKPVFIIGSLVVGTTHLIGGFMRQKIALVLLRALGGIGGAMMIPSALSLVIQMFPTPSHQARAISVFSSAGAIGNILGLLIGAIIVQYAGWSWIFWFVAIVGISIGILCFFLIPNARRERKSNAKFDMTGVGSLTVALTLFIFAVISGSTKGWGTAYVLAPLLISLLLFVLFHVWEARIPPDDAALPPRMWRLHNFGVLIGVALLPFLWWAVPYINITSWWEEVYGWTAINTAVHFLPMGIGGFIVSQFTGYLPKYFSHKHIILFGLGLAIISTILLHFGDSPDTYWPFTFPAFFLGTTGIVLVYAGSSIAIFAHTPPSVAGTVGAMFNCALQVGSAVGLAVVSSITRSVDNKTPPMNPPVEDFTRHLDEVTKDMWKAAFQGRAAGFWFLLAIICVQFVSISIFFRGGAPEKQEVQEDGEKNNNETSAKDPVDPVP